MNRNQLYWLCQWCGWTLQAMIGALVIRFRREDPGPAFATLAALTLFGLGMTHVYRTFVKRRAWARLPLKALAPRALIAIAVMAALGTAADHGANALLDHFPKDRPIPFGVMVLFQYVNWTFLLLVWSLFYYGIHFFWSYQNAEVARWKLEADLKKAELRALKSQINPHFIFNMLNSVRALIAEDPERAQLAVTKMARLLRTSLRTGRQALIPLSQELETVRDYLALEAIRLEERLRYSFQATPEALAAPTPAMLVQTLVENAVKHGVAKRPEGGEIEVAAQVQDRLLIITVSNTGQLEREPHHAGIGLKNAIERLKIHYGQEARLSLTGQSPGLVTAQMSIPMEPNP